MAFIQPCFIKKISYELKDKLKKLGYKDVGKVRYHGEPQYIYCNGSVFYESPCIIEERYNAFIDCDDNEDLFIALAALRDDSDYMQWFVSPKTHTNRILGCFGQVIGTDGHYKEIVGYEWHRHENKDNALTERLNSMIKMEVEDMNFLPHKATVEELIEHFEIIN